MNVIIASLIGVAMCFIIKTLSIKKDLQSNTVFIAEFKEDVQSGQMITAESLIADLSGVNKASVEVVRASTTLENMKKDMPELKYLADNPFRDIITFKTKGLEMDELSNLESQITDFAGIDDVYYDRDFLSSLTGSFTKIRIGVLTLSFLLFIGALIALGLRIKRDIRAFQDDIKILSIAGASDDAIIKTRFNWSLKWGLISALIAAIISMINIFFINNTLLDGLEITFLQAVIAIMLMVALVVGVHGLVTYRTIKAYLTKLNPSIKL